MTGPMLFLLAGLILGPEGASLIDIGPNTDAVRVFAEVTLALLLFSDASTVDASSLWRSHTGPVRLLAIALPLAILFGAIAAIVVFADLSLGTAALIAAILAPTDLSLGLSMFKNPAVPALVRRTLNVESGLNDGIASPFVTLFIALSISEVGSSSGSWLAEAVSEITIGLAAGVAVGVVGGYLIVLAKNHDWAADSSLPFAVFALAILSFVIASAMHGNGFIAAFVGGLAYRLVVRKAAHPTTEFAERTGTLMTFAVWAIFGAFAGTELLRSGFEWLPIAYALLSLFVVRMAAVAISLLGLKTRWETQIFAGWFGPRGLASVVFLLTAYDALSNAGANTAILLSAVSWTIVLSVVLHGASAGPVAAWYGKRVATFPEDAGELAEVQLEQVPRRYTHWHGRDQRWKKAENGERS